MLSWGCSTDWFTGICLLVLRLYVGGSECVTVMCSGLSWVRQDKVPVAKCCEDIDQLCGTSKWKGL